MNQEAIEKLKQFQIKNHLSGYNLVEPQTEGDIVSQSHSVSKPERTTNYPRHIKPLHERIMTAVTSSKLRTSQAIATYCGEEDIKVVNMHLGRILNAGKLVRYTNPASRITRYYTPEEAKAKGYKPDTLIRKVKKVKGKKAKSIHKREVDPRQMPLWNETTKPSLYTTEFLEKRVSEWQSEARKQAHEIEDLKAKLSEAQVQLIKARQTRDVTSEVTEVMEEVTKLRATVAYLESKLFGSK